MKRAGHFITFAGVSCVLLASIGGVATFSQAQGQQSGTLRVTSRLVQVNVVVKDKDGKPVTELTKDDFILLDQGQRQQIAEISEQKSSVYVAAAATPGHYTNQSAQGPQPPLTIIVLDTYNTRYRDIKVCMRPNPPPCVLPSMFVEVKKFISRMQPQDRVALYEFGEKLYLLQDFTGDPAALQRGLDRGKQYIPDYYPPSTTEPEEMSGRTMDAMHAIAVRLARVQGRKNLIWLSTGFPGGLGGEASQRILTSERTDKSAKSLGNSDVPLSAINPLGITAPGGGILGTLPGGGGGGGRHGGGGELAPPPGAVAAFSASMGGPPGGFGGLRNLAVESGGSAYERTNDIAGSIRRVIDDSSSTYLLGYYPDHNKWEGEFREIKVKVNRSGVEVRARNGYFAVADTASAEQKREEQLADAVSSPIESSDLTIDAQVEPVEVSGTAQIKIRIHLSPGQTQFRQDGNLWRGDAEVLWADKGADGQMLDNLGHEHKLQISQKEYDQISHDGLDLTETVNLRPATAEVRLVVRDVNSGAIGSVTIPVAGVFAPNGAAAPVKQ